MNGEPSDELTPREREAYEALSDPVSPPPECEARVVAALREEGLIGGAATGGSPAGSRATGAGGEPARPPATAARRRTSFPFPPAT